MNIIIVANHYAVCSARYMTDAFKRLGHDVRHIGPAMGRNIWGLTLPAEYEWTPDDITEVERAFETDVYVVMDSDPAILDSMKPEPPEYTKPVIVYGVDNHVRDYRRSYFDHYFLAHRNASVMDWNEYAPPGFDFPETLSPKRPRKDMTWLPVGYDPAYFTPSPIPFDDRAYDVILLGVMYPDRVQAIDELRKAGIKVLSGTGLVYEAYAKAHHNARIALCISPFGDLSQRWFEAAAMGCHVLGNIPADLADETTNRKIRLAGFSTYQPGAGETIVQRVRDLLTTYREDCQEATEHMQKVVIKSHSWDARAQVIIDWLGART